MRSIVITGTKREAVAEKRGIIEATKKRTFTIRTKTTEITLGA